MKDVNLDLINEYMDWFNNEPVQNEEDVIPFEEYDESMEL